MKKVYIFGLVVFLSACLPANPSINPTTTPEITPSEFVAIETSSKTEAPEVQTPESISSITPAPTGTNAPTKTTSPTVELPTPTSPQQRNGTGIRIDHTSVDLFSQIPDGYIQAASQLSLLFRHLSVGLNISEGLDCMMNKIQPRPPSCNRNLPPDQIIADPKYNRDNWLFEFHDPRYGGWYEKTYGFINRVDALAPGQFDFVSFKFGYVDGDTGSIIDDYFFNNDPNDQLPSIEDLEAMEARNPDVTMIYWSMGLARAIGTPDSASFNQQMRDYALNHDKIFMDIADIESHTPDGSPCFDNAGNGIEAICTNYTDEVNAGHLNAFGKQRMAKAVWVLMARLAGWEPVKAATP